MTSLCHASHNLKNMKKLFFLTIVINAFCIGNLQSQSFNKLYRFDSLKLNSVEFYSMYVANNAIYTAGIGIVLDSIYIISPGVFTKFDLQGNIQYVRYQDKHPNTTEFRDDVIASVSNNLFLLTGLNRDSSFSATFVNTNTGNTVTKRRYFPLSPSYFYTTPRSNAFINNNRFALIVNESYRDSSKSSIFIIDSIGNPINLFKIPSIRKYTNPLKITVNKSKNLILMTRSSLGDYQRIGYQYTTQLFELDTIGNILWRYETPLNRYVFGDGFTQIANGNYLMWGHEEFTHPDTFGLYREFDSIRVFIREIKPQVGVVSEKLFGLPYRGTIYDLKILKDSSIAFVGQYLDPSNLHSLQGYLIKLNKNRDSLFKRNLTHPTFSHGFADYYPQKIEELDNGDLVIGGYARDNKPDSPTKFTWGWLIRTDAAGCSFEPVNCRVPTTEVEKGPLSIKVFPNPTTGSFTVDLSGILTNQKTIFKLYNTVGQLVMSQEIDNAADKIEFNARHLIEGFYIFTLQTEGGQIVGNGKLQVQR
jgi:hypothetical protein